MSVPIPADWLERMKGTCPECNKPFYKNHGKQRFCSKVCARRARYLSDKRLMELGRQVDNQDKGIE